MKRAEWRLASAEKGERFMRPESGSKNNLIANIVFHKTQFRWLTFSLLGAFLLLVIVLFALTASAYAGLLR